MKTLLLGFTLFALVGKSNWVVAESHEPTGADSSEQSRSEQHEEDNQYATFLKGSSPNYDAALALAKDTKDLAGLKSLLDKMFKEDPSEELAEALAKLEDQSSDKKIEDLSVEELSEKIRALDREIVGETRGISKPDPIKEAKGRLLREELQNKKEKVAKETQEKAVAAVQGFRNAVESEQKTLVGKFSVDAYKNGTIGKDGTITFAGAAAGQTWVPTGNTVNGKPEYKTPDGKQMSVFSASQNTWLYKGPNDPVYRQRTSEELADVQASLKRNFSENQAPAIAVANVAARNISATVEGNPLLKATVGIIAAVPAGKVAGPVLDGERSSASLQKVESEKKTSPVFTIDENPFGGGSDRCVGGACKLESASKPQLKASAPSSRPSDGPGIQISSSQMTQLAEAGVDLQGNSPVILSHPSMDCPWCDALKDATGLPVVKAPPGFRGNGGSFPQVFDPKKGALLNSGDSWRTYNNGVIPSTPNRRRISGR